MMMSVRTVICSIVACSLLLAAHAARPGGAATDGRLACNAGCSSSCTPASGGASAGYKCKSCKKGFAREGGSAPTCNLCAPGYGTAIDPGLPPSARRRFAACKREPCTRCSACPHGTTSNGGARGVYGSVPAANGTGVATCAPPSPQAFRVTITTNPKSSAGAWVCDASFGAVLGGLIAASIDAQGGYGAAATQAGGCRVDANNAAAYTFDVSYQGPGGIKDSVLASLAEDCHQPSADTQTGGICSSMPNAAGPDNLCVAFSKAAASSQDTNLVLCNGAGAVAYKVTVYSTTLATLPKAECDPALGPLVAELMERSVKKRRPVTGARVTQDGNCSLMQGLDKTYLGVYTMDVVFWGKKELKELLVGVANKTHLLPRNYTGGVCDAYPEANTAGENLCQAVASGGPSGITLDDPHWHAYIVDWVEPTIHFVLGFMVAQTAPGCSDAVGGAIRDSVEQFLDTQASS